MIEKANFITNIRSRFGPAKVESAWQQKQSFDRLQKKKILLFSMLKNPISNL